MILALDIDNTAITVGGFDEERIWFTSEVSTNYLRTAMEYAVMLKSILDIHRVDPAQIEGGIIASVVPGLNNTFKEVFRLLTDVNPFIVGPGLKTGVNISIGDPGELGAGLVVSAAAAQEKYEAPMIIIDLGTATTFSVMNRKKEFIGVVIYPGVLLSFNALTKNTAQLPQIPFDRPGKVIGDSSQASMQSGMFFGNAALIDGVIDRIEEELGEACTVVATGMERLCGHIIPYCRHRIRIDTDLPMAGLRSIYYRNTKRRK
ncbi:MAG: type III pantothenate kinase [Lachnospiraceae bacterium]|nr:type III pantothenate kinase [Lachnospiraceae bacterium]